MVVPHLGLRSLRLLEDAGEMPRDRRRRERGGLTRRRRAGGLVAPALIMRRETMMKRQTRTILASLAIAATGLFAPAPAAAGKQCDVIVAEECAENWQGMYYTSYEACLEREWIDRCSKF